VNKYVRAGIFISCAGLAVWTLILAIRYEDWQIFAAQEVFLASAGLIAIQADRALTRHHKILARIRAEAEKALDEAQQAREDQLFHLNLLLGREYIKGEPVALPPDRKGGD